MNKSFELRRAEVTDREAFARLIALGFAVPHEASLRFVDVLPPHYARLVGDPPEACVAILPLGQWFGGRRVECAGIQAVSVAPEARGKHVARRTMEAVVRELAEQRVAVSSLFASTQPLYRSVGYEHAGTRHSIELDLRAIDRSATHTHRAPLAPARRLGVDDVADVQSLHRTFVSGIHGAVERDEYQWRRVAEPGGTAAERLGIGDGTLDGYAILLPEQEQGRRELSILDIAFRTESAGRRLVALLRDFATVMPTATMHGSPTHPLLGLLDQQWFSAKLTDIWMLRVVDLACAISQRGFRTIETVAFRIDLDDPLIGDGAGDWVIEVVGARGFARRPTRADDQPCIRCGPRGLAAIYSGFRSPQEARLIGLLEGDDEAVARAAAAFAAPTPWMSDRF